MELRPHQAAAIEGLRNSLARGNRRPMLQLPTGAGKTFIAARIIDMARAKGHRVIFLVDAISLIDQTVQRFYEAGIRDVGVIQADHPMTDYSKPVQVASAQTLARRNTPEAGLVIVDEAHRMYRFVTEWMVDPDWQNVPFLGLSATPWAKGLGNLYDDLVAPITMRELIEQGYLCPFRAFAPASPDLTSVKTVAGDYHEGQLADVMGDDTLVADIVSTWIDKGEGRPTLCFGVDRAHARKLQRRFQASGIGAGYIDAHTPADERQSIERQLDRGEISVVCNVGCLTTGVDWAVGCIILARPTKSEMLYVQMVGRGLRVNPPMPDCVILDHAGNCLRLGMVTDIQHDRMDTSKKGERQTQTRTKDKMPVECKSCTFLMAHNVLTCPACGHERLPVRDIEEGSGELQQVDGKKVKASIEEKQRWFSGLLWYAADKGYKPGWASNKYREKFGVWPNSLAKIPAKPGADVIGYIRHSQIKWAKSKKRAAA